MDDIIPDDIIETANRFVTIGDYRIFEPLSIRIARLILAERERCATIAGTWPYKVEQGVGILPSHAAVASAIRTPPTGEEQ